MKTDRITPKWNRIEPSARKFQLPGRQKRLRFQIVFFIALGWLVFGAENARQPYADALGPTGDSSARHQKTASEQSFLGAALEGNVKTVQSALEQGMDVNTANQDGRTALMVASYNGHTDIVRLLLERGARIDGQDSSGRTALMFAASGPYPPTVELLLSNKADPNSVDTQEGWTALMFAAAEGQAGVVEVLLNHGADKTLKDADGETALDFAGNNKHAEVVSLLE